MPDVKVLEEDVAKAIRNDSNKCAIGRAMARHFPDARHVLVDLQTIRITRNGQRISWLTPPSAQDHIIAFDAGATDIPPFTLYLRDPHITEAKPSARSKAQIEVPPTRKGTPGSTPVKIGGKPAPIKKKGTGKYRLWRSYGRRVMRINQPTENAD